MPRRTEPSHLEALYLDLDHLPQAKYIITETVKACANMLGTWASVEPDKREQRRTSSSEAAHRLRLAIEVLRG